MTGRVVTDVVDGSGLYFSRLASGGGWVFFAGPAVDSSGELAAEARVKPPYHLSPSAHVRAQTRYIFSRLAAGLSELSSFLHDICQVGQYISWKAHADGYIEAHHGPEFLYRNRPNSALIETGDFVPEGCVVIPTGIAAIPGDGLKKEIDRSGLPTPGRRPDWVPSTARNSIARSWRRGRTSLTPYGLPTMPQESIPKSRLRSGCGGVTRCGAKQHSTLRGYSGPDSSTWVPAWATLSTPLST